METLDSKQKATLQEYQMVVDANDVNASIQILKDCNWNLQNAINTAFELQKYALFTPYYDYSLSISLSLSVFLCLSLSVCLYM